VVAFVSASPDDEKPVDKKMRSCSFHRYTWRSFVLTPDKKNVLIG
jgi:hypothetical protein